VSDGATADKKEVVVFPLPPKALGNNLPMTEPRFSVRELCLDNALFPIMSEIPLRWNSSVKLSSLSCSSWTYASPSFRCPQ
jgi:hypothetical protein